MDDKEYTDGIEELLVEWVERSRALSKGHGKARKVKRTVHNIISIVVIFLSTCAASYTSMTLNEQASGTVVAMLGQTSILALSITTAVHNFLKLESSAGEHGEASNAFQQLANTIDMELSKARADRMYRAPAFLVIIQNRLESTSAKAPGLFVAT